MRLLPMFLAMFGCLPGGFGIVMAEEAPWRFATLAEVEVPTPEPEQRDWVRTDIDAFVLRELQRHQLRPQAEAERHTLIRRVAFDLTGLPPSPDQIQAYLGDTSPAATSRMVDRFLASPHYGERWARHWLDVARFGETDGILTVNEDKPRGDRWRYRDATVRALNADLPYNTFVRYQFVEPPASDAAFRDLRQFIHLGTRLQRNADPNDKQHHRLDDMVATTGNAFLGLTVRVLRTDGGVFRPGEGGAQGVEKGDRLADHPSATPQQRPMVLSG